MLRRVYVCTYGWQMNEKDSEVFSDSVLREDEVK